MKRTKEILLFFAVNILAVAGIVAWAWLTLATIRPIALGVAVYFAPFVLAPLAFAIWRDLRDMRR